MTNGQEAAFPKRVIKFRAWELPQTELFCKTRGLSFNPDFKGQMVHAVHKRSLLSYIIDHPKEYILMQFTGLHDKNGKEIWEGDIIHSYSSLPMVVIKHPYGWGVEFNAPEGKATEQITADFFREAHDDDGIEDLGNRFENPELLGEKS